MPKEIGDHTTDEGGETDPLIDHLGQALRVTLSTGVEQPAYLGDPALPLEFDESLKRVKKSVELREQGVEAVRETLESLIIPEADNENER